MINFLTEALTNQVLQEALQEDKVPILPTFEEKEFEELEQKMTQQACNLTNTKETKFLSKKLKALMKKTVIK